MPSISPACADRNRDFRPVTGWRRTRRWRTGLKAMSFFIGEVGEPELPPRIHVRMQADPIFDLVLEPFVERLVGRAHVREFGVAAPGGNGAARQQGIGCRDRVERTVGVPQLVRELEQVSPAVGRQWLAGSIDIREVLDAGAELAYLPFGTEVDGTGRAAAGVFERAEIQGEPQLLFIR